MPRVVGQGSSPATGRRRASRYNSAAGNSTRGNRRGAKNGASQKIGAPKKPFAGRNAAPRRPTRKTRASLTASLRSTGVNTSHAESNETTLSSEESSVSNDSSVESEDSDDSSNAREVSSDPSEEDDDDDNDDDDDDDDDDEEEGDDESENEEQTSTPPKTRSNARRRAPLIRNEADSRTKYYFVKNLDVKAFRHKEAITRFRYLLSLGDLFRRFVDYKAQKNKDFRDILEQATLENQKALRAATRGPTNSRASKNRRSSRIVELNEAEDLMADDEEDEKITVFSESPGFVHGELRQYQIDGLNWLVSLFVNNINGILADEMGLGKTFQCIAFLAYLRHIQNIRGPHLVIVPKSTIQNWAREFGKWTPEVEVLVITGDKEERAQLIRNTLLPCKFDVCITSFELVIREKSALQKLAWEYVIVDEAHRIKNEESILSKIMRVLFSKHRLLITGTPLQNNLHELWALLNFLLPDVFSDAEVFDEWFSNNSKDSSDAEESDTKKNGHKSPPRRRRQRRTSREIADDSDVSSQNDEETHEGGKTSAGDESGEKDNSKNQDEMIEQLRSLLSPFLMRRVKRDVEHTLLPKKEINLYVGMTNMQLEWYQKLLEKDLDAVNNTNKSGGTKEGKMRLLNVVMQLRKCCNHPYLFEGAEPGPPFTTDEHLVNNSGKMILLDKLLARLKAQGSRVLIFSQMGRMLDILEDYCSLRDYEYCRIDGSTVHEDRVAAIDEYNRPGSSKFIFLLTTRAGGLGINLTTADQVIIYDSDWNPQADLQAMDRAHRIGQTKQVYVYRFVVEHAIEEKVLERAAHKLRLDQLVIQQGGANRNSAQERAKAAASKEELANMIRHGAQEVFDKKSKVVTSEMSIEDIIASGEERTKELNAKYSGLGLDELRKFTFDKPPQNQGPIINRSQKNTIEDDFRHHHRRARNTTFHEELIVNDVDHEPRGNKVNTLRAPKQLTLHDFQFFPKELYELQSRELAWYRKKAGIRLSSEDYSSDEEDESEERNAEIENAQPLTEEDIVRKEKLIAEGFPNFSKRDFHHFLNLVIKYGGQKNIKPESLDELCKEWPDKPPSEIKRYYKVFFERYKEISEYERYMNLLEAGESRARKINHRMDLLKQRVEETRTPLSTMNVTQPSGGSATRHRFSEANDRFLLYQMNRIGLDTPNSSEKIRDSIRTCGLFDFDWYFMSRTATEIGRRCTSLLNIIAKEVDGVSNGVRGVKRKGRPPINKDITEHVNKRVKDGMN